MNCLISDVYIFFLVYTIGEKIVIQSKITQYQRSDQFAISLTCAKEKLIKTWVYGNVKQQICLYFF